MVNFTKEGGGGAFVYICKIERDKGLCILPVERNNRVGAGECILVYGPCHYLTLLLKTQLLTYSDAL